MNKAYNRTYWKNYPSIDSPVNEQNLNNIEVGVDEIDNRVIVLDTTKFDKLDAMGLIKNITFDLQTGILTKYYYNGSTEEINTGLSKVSMNLRFDSENQILYIINADGTEDPIDLSVFITNYEFEDSDTIAHNVSSDGKVKSVIKEGSIEEKHLRPDYLADIRVESTKAKSSADAAEESADNAAESATEAESWARGGTNTREDEDTDNAKYYSEQAKASAESAAEIAGGNFIPTSEKGEAGGVATLDDDGKVPEEQLPSGIGGGNPDNVTIIKNEDGTLTAVSVGFTGTQEEYEAADEAGEIEDGTIVNITDDYAEGGGGGNITVDDELSETSENPVQNKVVTEAIANCIQTTGGTMTGLLQPKAGISAAGKNGFIAYPEDGYYKANGDVNGCIKIKLPGGFNGIMRKFDVSVYNYSEINTLIDLSVGCYAHESKFWYKTVAKSIIAGTNINKTYTKVRFCKDSQDNAVIIIGNTNSVWSYSVVQVHNILVGFSNNNYVNSYSGWDVTITDDISDLTVQYTIEDTTI